MELNGTYRGFSPTDESGVGLGELEVVIDDDKLAIRFATGLLITDGDAPRSLLRPMSPAEVANRFNDGADVAGITGYQLGEDGMMLLFMPESAEAPQAPLVMALRFVSDEIDGIFGPTFLFTPEQVAAGKFDAAIEAIEAEQGDPGGHPPPEQRRRTADADGHRVDPRTASPAGAAIWPPLLGHYLPVLVREPLLGFFQRNAMLIGQLLDLILFVFVAHSVLRLIFHVVHHTHMIALLSLH